MLGSLKTAHACAASTLLLLTLLFGRAASTDVEAARFRQLEGQSQTPAGDSFINRYSFDGQQSRDPCGAPTRREPTARVSAVPSSVGLRESGRGLLIRTWVNGAGPF